MQILYMLNFVSCDLKVCIFTIFVIVYLQNFGVVCRMLDLKLKKQFCTVIILLFCTLQKCCPN